jgi:hypothetical protein
MTGLILGLIFFFYLSYSWSDRTQRLTILKDGLILRLAFLYNLHSWTGLIWDCFYSGTYHILGLFLFDDWSALGLGLQGTGLVPELVILLFEIGRVLTRLVLFFVCRHGKKKVVLLRLVLFPDLFCSRPDLIR